MTTDVNAPEPSDDAVRRRTLLRQRSRSRALLAVLLGLAALFYAISAARLGQQRASRSPAQGGAP